MKHKVVIDYINGFLFDMLPRGWRVVGYFDIEERNYSIEQIDRLSDTDSGSFLEIHHRWLFGHVVCDDRKLQIPFQFLTPREPLNRDDLSPKCYDWSEEQLYAYQVSHEIMVILHKTEAVTA
jgi:hypothetical protein